MITPALLAASAALLSQAATLEPTGSATLPDSLDPAAFAAFSSELFLDEPGDGRTWARGATYKASFGHDGFVYRPFLGSDAPRSFPLELDLDRVRIAGEELPLAPRTRKREGRTVSLDRGGIVEVYHLAERQVEQTFVLDDLPVRGEIVLTMAVDTDLEPGLDGAGFTFSSGLGGVRYGGATAIDARGRQRSLEQHWTGEAIEIVVPADFVQSAELPLVVDPILSTFGVTNDTRRQVDVDVAYDGQNAIYQIVWSQVESGLDQDVFSAFYNVGAGTLFGAVSIDVTSSSWSMPRTAAAYGPQQFLCVALVGQTVDNRRVWGRTREAATGVRDAQFVISGTGARHVDVGGKGNGPNSAYDYMTVWQQGELFGADFDILAQPVDSDSTLTGPRLVIDGDSDDLDRFPSISKSSGRPGTSNADNEYMIAWEREVGTDDRNIRCQVIEYTGTTLGHSQFRGYSFSDSRRPDVSTWDDADSYNGERYWVVAFERRTGSDYDIFGVVAQDGFADNAKSLAGMQDLDRDLDQLDPRLAYDGSDFLIAYRTPIGSSNQLYFTSVNVLHDDGELRLGTSVRRDSVVRSNGDAVRYGMATEFDGGGSVSSSVGLLPAVATPITGDSEVTAAFVADFDPTVVGAQFCEAAANSTGGTAWIRATRGAAPVAGDSLSLLCSGLPANSFGHFICSTQDGFVVNPGGSSGNLCLQGAVGRFNRPNEVLNSGVNGAFDLLVDSSSFPTPTGSTSALSGQAWYFQTWFRDFGPTSNFSNGVQVTFD
ncbi:MAG: hypothetical protein AAGB93_13445 [Planctomycetota bacterium]